MERRATPASFVRWAVAVALMALVLPAALYAQETRGRITGRVTDTSKAIVPGATVTVTDATRGTTVSATTNEQGLFQVSYLLPGTYRVTVELHRASRSTSRRTSILQISRDASTCPISLEVGALEESVSVIAESPVVNTSDANMGLVGRPGAPRVTAADPRRSLQDHGPRARPGALGQPAAGSARTSRRTSSATPYDGTRSNRSDLLIDGAPSTATANANEVIATYVPPSDLVQEFKVQTATFDAQFGNTEGGVTSMTSSPGTNRFHGSAYYFAEPSSWGANDFFGKARGQAMSRARRTGPASPSAARSASRSCTTDGQDVLHVRLRAHQGRPPALRHLRRQLGADRGAAQRRLLGLSGNVTIYDPLTRSGSHDSSGAAVRRQHHPGEPDQPHRARRSSSTYSLPKNPGLIGNINDSTLPETANYNTRDGPRGPEDLDQQPDVRQVQRYKRDSTYNDYLNSLATQTMFQFRVVPGGRGRRAHLQPDDRPQRPLRLQPLRPHLGVPGRGGTAST